MRRVLVRGESVVASLGLASAVILLASVGGSSWWALRTHRESMERAELERIASVSELLRSSVESKLREGDVSGVRSLVAQTSVSHGLDVVRVELLTGEVIAAEEPALLSDTSLDPLAMVTPTGEAEVQEVVRREADGFVVVRLPVRVDGRDSALLRVEDRDNTAMVRRWEMQAGVGAIGAGAMAMLLIVYRLMRARLRVLGAIGEALAEASRGERSEAVLRVSGSMGPEARAWNELLAEREEASRKANGKGVPGAPGVRAGGETDMHSALDALWSGVLVVGSSGRVRFANGTAGVLLGCKREDLIGSVFSERVEDDAVVDVVMNAASGKEKRKRSAEMRRSGEGEGEGLLRFTARALRKEDAGSALVVVEDVTQQRMSDEARNQFVAQATHELRTPLTNMRLYIDMLIDDDGLTVETRSKSLNVVSQEARRLERIVGDMLSVAEIESGQLRLAEGEVRTGPIFEELKADFAAQAESKEILLRFDLDPKMPELRGDRDKLVMVLHNLVGNAVKYTPAGGEVDVSASVEDAGFVVRVRDNGIGIKPEEQEKIFEKFYRAKDKRISGVTGTGLGLALAREVVRMHGGEIAVESEVDKGSTFTVTLPMSGDAGGASAAA